MQDKYGLVYKGKSEVREQIGNNVCEYTHKKKKHLLFVRLCHGWVLYRQRQKQMWYPRREEVLKNQGQNQAIVADSRLHTALHI